MELNTSPLPQDFTSRDIYKLMIGAILPRPIGWISTLGSDGKPNLAPYSFFNAVSSSPPILLFCPETRGTDGQPKDSLVNVQHTGEFVVNIVTEATAEAMNITATEFPADIDEFEAAGLHTAPAVAVSAPRVAESPIHFECKLLRIVTIGEAETDGKIVIGRIVHIHIDDSVLLPRNRIDLAALRPIGRLAGGDYCRVTDIFSLVRPLSQVQPKSPEDT